MTRSRRSIRLASTVAAVLLFGGMAATRAQVAPTSNPPVLTEPFLSAVGATRIADPKLAGSSIEIAYLLDAPGRYDVTVEVLSQGVPVHTVFDGSQGGSNQPRKKTWDGKDLNGDFLDPGSYVLRVTAKNPLGITQRVDYPLDLVRLGLERISAESSAGTNEWQMVYFLRKGKYVFSATPSAGEYRSRAELGEVSDLDLDDGSARPVPLVHPGTAEPVLELKTDGNWRLDDDWFNYPVCYLAGAVPQFTVTFGATCTNAAGQQSGCNYPVAGCEIRCVANDGTQGWSNSDTSISPGGTSTFQGLPLTPLATRLDGSMHWSWQWRETGASNWTDIPGELVTPHRVYTIIAPPHFNQGGSGTQYSGPWVEVAEYFHTFHIALGITPNSPESVVEALFKGFFGQNGTLTTAIEDVHYDCPSEGGDGGATHYYEFGSNEMFLSRLLDAHAYGRFVNCTDCAASTSVMAGMLGIPNVQMMRLGSMQLRAIWGIGTDDYTLDLWSNGGGGGHGFSYHHIVTRDSGVHISDACLWVDEDGHPNALPGLPGYNHDREWSSYELLLAKANVSWSLDPLPKLR